MTRLFTISKRGKRTRKKLKKVAKKGQKQLKKLEKKAVKKQLSDDDVDKMNIDDQVVHYQQEMVREQNAEDKAHMKKAREQVAAQKALIKKRQLGLQKDVSRHNTALKRIDSILNSVDAGILQLAKQRHALHLDFKERARDDMIRAEDEKYKLSLAMKRLPRSLVKPLAKKGDNKAVKKEERKIEGKQRGSTGEEVQLGEANAGSKPKLDEMVSKVESAAKRVVNDPSASAKEKMLAGNVHKSAVSVKQKANP